MPAQMARGDKLSLINSKTSKSAAAGAPPATTPGGHAIVCARCGALQSTDWCLARAALQAVEKAGCRTGGGSEGHNALPGGGTTLRVCTTPVHVPISDHCVCNLIPKLTDGGGPARPAISAHYLSSSLLFSSSATTLLSRVRVRITFSRAPCGPNRTAVSETSHGRAGRRGGSRGTP